MWFERKTVAHTRLTLATYHAQQAQAAQALNSEQPHLGKNSRQPTMG